MEGDDGQLVPPRLFLPAAERYSLATWLDRWVVGAAIKWLAGHTEHLKRSSFCSINLSGHSLGEDALFEFIVKELDNTKIPVEKICFEVTETATIANLSRAMRFINVLKELGCQFALDDFGSGLSSFAYLKNLPVDFLKIDGMFIRNIASDPADWAIVRSINEISHVIGKKTIAEFVENESILTRVQEIGVDYVQGYGIGRPQSLLQLM